MSPLRPLLFLTLTSSIGLTACVDDTSELSERVGARAGDAPELSGGLVVTPGRISFGIVDPDCGPIAVSGLIRNGGQTRAVIESATVEGEDAQTFRLRFPSLPQDLEPGQDLTYAVEASVEEPRGYDAELVVVAQIGPRRLRIDRQITAISDDSPLRTDRFVQNSRRATDVLFVIDDSASMVAEQDALGRNFVGFLQATNDGLADFQIGVTTTDLSESGEGGRLVPVRSEGDTQGGTRTAHIVTRASTPNPVEAFRRNALVGIDGAPVEQGLEAAARALTPPLIEDDNLGFLRPDASLALVFVSDENDGSPRPPAVYADLFLSLKDYRTSQVSASAIIGPEPDGCRGDEGRATAGTAYAEVTRRLRGRVESICTSDWGATLARLSGIAFGLQGRFSLSGIPDMTPEVSVNGNARPQINEAGETVWTVDPVTRVLTFGRQFTPPEGAIVEITYPVQCPADDGRP